MELIINDYQLPGKIEFNFEELKTEIARSVEHYKTLVYTDADIPDAKKDRATLNKLSTALDNERKKIKKQCLEPYNEFEKQVKELQEILAEPIGLIDAQISQYKEAEIIAKKAAIEDLWETIEKPDFVTMSALWDERWLNKTMTITKIKTGIETKLKIIDEEIETLKALPEFSFEALEYYKKTLNIHDAINKAKDMKEIAKKKSLEHADKMADELLKTSKPLNNTDAPKTWLNFSANLTVDDALALKAFFESRNIEFKPL